MSELPLKEKKIILAETRELDILATLLERRGAEVLRFPLVSIYPTSDTHSVKAWIERFIAAPPDWFILLTGEGISRLLIFCEEHQLDRDAFVAALEQSKIISRGPKPARELRKIGITPEMLADQPTTSGIITTLDQLEIENKNIAVQLYGSDPNLLLTDYLAKRQVRTDPVAPYVYADNSGQNKVNELLKLIDAQLIDLIVFTSKAQVDFLFRKALKQGSLDTLRNSLNNLTIAAVGPIVTAELKLHQVMVEIMPERLYFMKPLVSAIVEAFRSEKDQDENKN